MTELLPCPFCGGEAEWKLGAPGGAWVSCKICPAETDDGSIPHILASWNTRADLYAAALEREAALREALDKARDPGREPDYCYDEEWEYTMAWAEWPDLMDGHDLTEPTAIYTLYKGPQKWVVRVPTDGDDSEVRIFDSEEAARADPRRTP